MNSFALLFPWGRYSRKLVGKIEKPHCVGYFSKEESEGRGMVLAEGESGDIGGGNYVKVYWLVDRDDGVIVDARFQVFGQTALVGAAQVVCELCVGKNYDQVKRVSATLIDQQVRDKADVQAFPVEASPHINLVLEAIELAAEKCDGLPLPSSYVAPPVPKEIEVREGGYPGWDELSNPQKLLVIEGVLDQEIRPYIALDGGGVEVINLRDNKELIIAYQGACTSCYSSVGTTLSYIQQILRAKVHPDLSVIPENIDLH